MRLALLLAAGLLSGCADGGSSAPPAPTPGAAAGDVWQRLASLNEPRQEVGVAEAGGRIYVAGGYRGDGSTANTLEAYDVAANAWSFAAPMPLAVNHPGAAAVEGRLYVMGGALPSGASTNALLEYDPARNEWRTRAPMPTARNAPAVAVAGGRIYVAGGAPGGRTFEAYDPGTDTWSRLADMPTPRNHLAGGAAGERLFAVGGRPPNTLNVHEGYSVGTAAWSPLAPMPTGRSGHAGAVVRGCLYVFGGEGNAARPDGVFPQNEAYDPRANTWVSLAPMPTPRHGIGAVAIGDRIYLPGGATVQGFGATGVHEAYSVPRDKSCL